MTSGLLRVLPETAMFTYSQDSESSDKDIVSCSLFQKRIYKNSTDEREDKVHGTNGTFVFLLHPAFVCWYQVTYYCEPVQCSSVGVVKACKQDEVF